MTDPATPDTTMPEPTEAEPTEADTTTTTALEQAVEVHERIGTALAAASDAAELAASGVLPSVTTRSLMRSLSAAHRHLADASAMVSPAMVGAARVIDLATAPAEVGRRVLCSCGQAFTPAGWELHRTGSEDQHTVTGQLVGTGTGSGRRAVDRWTLAEADQLTEEADPGARR